MLKSNTELKSKIIILLLPLLYEVYKHLNNITHQNYIMNLDNKSETLRKCL